MPMVPSGECCAYGEHGSTRQGTHPASAASSPEAGAWRRCEQRQGGETHLGCLSGGRAGEEGVGFKTLSGGKIG